MKKSLNLFIFILIIVIISGCSNLSSKQDSKVASTIDNNLITDVNDVTKEPKNNQKLENSQLDDKFKKYQYDCNNNGDHSKHDYALQDELTKKCQNKCCNSEYCKICQWSEYGNCYSNCENEIPNGTCVNCDGFCWESGHLKFLESTINTC
jgi:uncharacterized protein YxeA